MKAILAVLRGWIDFRRTYISHDDRRQHLPESAVIDEIACYPRLSSVDEVLFVVECRVDILIYGLSRDAKKIC